MNTDFTLLVATVDKLAKKMQAKRYIDSICVEDALIKVSYSNGFKQGLKLPVSGLGDYQADYGVLREAIAAKLEEFNEKIAELASQNKNQIIDFDYKAFLEIELEKYRVVLKDSLQKELLDELLQVVDSIPKPKGGTDGVDGKDVDIEEITQHLQLLFNDYITNSQEYIDSYLANISIPQPKDGKDGRGADEAKIIAALKEIIEQFLNEQVSAWNVVLEQTLAALELKQRAEINTIIQELIKAIPIPKDGKDADIEVIKAGLSQELQNLIFKDTQRTKEELTTLIVSELEERVKNITIIAEKVEPGRDGVDGKDGVDADAQKITQEVLEVVTQGVKESWLLVKKELEEGLESIRSSITIPKDGVDGKDGESIKGEKGDRGNGIKHAEIDGRGDLIITTDDKTINAGEVSVNNFYGGGGGVSLIVTSCRYKKQRDF